MVIIQLQVSSGGLLAALIERQSFITYCLETYLTCFNIILSCQTGSFKQPVDLVVWNTNEYLHFRVYSIICRLHKQIFKWAYIKDKTCTCYS